jgi:hypothetical protein
MYCDDEELEDERIFVVENARKNNKGSKEEIELYEELTLALDLMQNDSFRVDGSRICNGLEFHIVTQYPNGLPLNVGSMFFNVNASYDVKVHETPLYINGRHNDPGEMNFQINIKKH